MASRWQLFFMKILLNRLLCWGAAFLFLIVYNFQVSAQDSCSISIDHIPIAVRDLEKAVNLFTELGFSVKPGRKHANGIENAHIKFKDGSALELITAHQISDKLTRQYLSFLEEGDGPAYLSLGCSNPSVISEKLTTFDPEIEMGSYYTWITFPENSPHSYIFFISYIHPPVDVEIYLNHGNGVLGIKSVELAKQKIDQESVFFRELGCETDHESVVLKNQKIHLKIKSDADNARPIQKITLFVADIFSSMEALPKAFPFTMTNHNSYLIEPEYLPGFQLEFVQKEQ